MGALFFILLLSCCNQVNAICQRFRFTFGEIAKRIMVSFAGDMRKLTSHERIIIMNIVEISEND